MPDELGDERTNRDERQAQAQIVERVIHQPAAEAVSLEPRVDVGRGEAVARRQSSTPAYPSSLLSQHQA